jgi:hypothetical protein
VLELLQDEEGGLGFSRPPPRVRLCCTGCAGRKAVHMRLVLRWETTDEAGGMLVRSFPAVAPLEVKGEPGGDDGQGHARAEEGPE